jgi:rRNA maturation endonuclease Nob1
MKDADIDPTVEHEYECFGCGNIVVAAGDPGSCPKCGGEMRNRQTPLE